MVQIGERNENKRILFLSWWIRDSARPQHNPWKEPGGGDGETKEWEWEKIAVNDKFHWKGYVFGEIEIKAAIMELNRN